MYLNDFGREEYPIPGYEGRYTVTKKSSELKKMNETKRKSISGVPYTGEYIVGCISKANGLFSTSPQPARHLTESSARQEAARLANVSKEKKFVVMKVCGIASVEDVTWE